ncbi:MAG: metallophosphoesterase [Nanoarchaeota archaeon]|nr:metallophosphoesterase [Nanoarchaeota archaeon]
MEYTFIDKSLFFPKKGILVIGDFHIGYESALRQSGILVPARQVQDMVEDLKNIFKKIKERGWNLNKIVFLGDLKHLFYFDFKEKHEFQDILAFLGNYFSPENIILIKGNHDTMDYTFEGKLKKMHVEGDIAFLHGHEDDPKLYDKRIKTIVFGHIHPSVFFSSGAKKEAYKCFLTGKYKEKEFIVLPSFLGFIEGTPVNYYDEDYIESFSILPKKAILKFRVHAIGKDKVYSFGEIRKLKDNI